MSDQSKQEQQDLAAPVPAITEDQAGQLSAHRARLPLPEPPAGFYAPMGGERRGLIYHERDYAAVGKTIKAKIVSEFPRSLAFYNYSSLALFGTFTDHPPLPGQDTWFCPPWGMIVVGCTSRWVAARYDPNGTQANTPSTTSLLERYILQVFDVDMGPLLWWAAAAPT